MATRNLVPGSEESERSSSEQRHVLVVEDDEIVVELIQSIISRLGYVALVAENATDALKAFEGCSDSAICVILDYGIPGMDPSRLLYGLREINPDVKVLVSSGYSSNFIEQDFPLDSVDGFIPKPYEPKILIDRIRKLAEAK